MADLLTRAADEVKRGARDVKEPQINELEQCVWYVEEDSSIHVTKGRVQSWDAKTLTSCRINCT